MYQDMENEKFYPESQESDDDDEDDDNDEDGNDEKSGSKKPYIMDPDHRLLLRVTKPLLQSRNAAVSCSFMISIKCKQYPTYCHGFNAILCNVNLIF